MLECLAAEERLLRVCFTIVYKLQILSISLTLSKRWPSVTGLLEREKWQVYWGRNVNMTYKLKDYCLCLFGFGVSMAK